jgi:hypothetical protein
MISATSHHAGAISLDGRRAVVSCQCEQPPRSIVTPVVSQDLHFDPAQLGNSVLSRKIMLSGGLLLVAVWLILATRPPRLAPRSR